MRLALVRKVRLGFATQLHRRRLVYWLFLASNLPTHSAFVGQPSGYRHITSRAVLEMTNRRSSRLQDLSSSAGGEEQSNESSDKAETLAPTLPAVKKGRQSKVVAKEKGEEPAAKTARKRSLKTEKNDADALEALPSISQSPSDGSGEVQASDAASPKSPTKRPRATKKATQEPQTDSVGTEKPKKAPKHQVITERTLLPKLWNAANTESSYSKCVVCIM
jgi:hypothetical protein